MSLRNIRLTGLLLAASFLSLLLIWHEPAHKLVSKWSEIRHSTPFTTPPPSPNLQTQEHLSSDQCDLFPDPGNIAIAVKTGATEAVSKIPMLMLSTLRCAANVRIFSDLEQDIGGHHLIDALEDVSTSDMEGNSDFDFYWKLKEAEKLGQVEDLLKDYHDPRTTSDLAAWTLDKYKQLHILEKLYAEFPDKQWYIMMDADTYVVWPTLLMWLRALPDPTSHKMYLGSPANVGDVEFAHGGSGIFLSAAAMHEFAVVRNGTAKRWDRLMHDECCGDYVIGSELKKNGIELKPSWPTVNGQKPVNLPFGPTHWCQPVVTMHKVRSHEMNQLKNFESARSDKQIPLTFAELYTSITQDTIPESFFDWDNESADVVAALDSFEACQAACESDPECFQFLQRGERCTLSHSIHLGGPRDADAEGVWRSGWLKDRIDAWVQRQPACEVEFPWT